MKGLARNMVLLTVAMAIALPLWAAQEKKGGKKREGRQDQVTQLLAQVEKANLTDEQKKKVKEIAANYRPKLAAAREKVPAEVQKALGEARKKAADEGKKGKEAESAVQAAVKLTPEQEKAVAEQRELNAAFRKEIAQVLTAEQRQQINLNVGREGGKRRNP